MVRWHILKRRIMKKLQVDDSLLLAKALELRMIEAVELVDILSDWQAVDGQSLESLLVDKGSLSNSQWSHLVHATGATDSAEDGHDHATCHRGALTPGLKKTKTRQRPTLPPALPPAANRYEWTEELARGGLGAVWSAYDKTLERRIAAKELLPDTLDSPAMVARFVDEARITSQLEHPGIVPIYDLGTKPDGCPFYAMKHLDGRPFNEVVAEYHAVPSGSSEKTVRLFRLLETLVDVCEAMAYAHQKDVIHRDLKPHNIMVGEFGETVVVDWGLAKSTSEPIAEARTVNLIVAEKRPDGNDDTRPTGRSRTAEQTCQGDVMGTPAYLSPEQARGEVALGTSSDIYTLGVILYQILVGEVPYQGQDANSIVAKVREGGFRPPRAIDRAVPRPLDAICRRAMQSHPSDRYATAKQMAADIRAWMVGEPVQAYSERLLERTQRWIRHHKTIALSVVASLGISVAVLAMACWAISSAHQAEILAHHEATMAHQKAEQARIAEQSAKEAALAMLSDGLEAADTLLIEESHMLQFYPGLGDNRQRLLEQAESSYSKFAHARFDDPKLKQASAAALLRLGDARQLLGKPQLARDAFKSAHGILTSLSDATPDVDNVQLLLANSEIGLGLIAGKDAVVEEQSQALGKSEAELHSAIERLGMLVRKNPNNNEFLFARSRARVVLARRLMTSQPEAAISHFESACRELSELLHPQSPTRLVTLWQSVLSELGRLHLRSGDYDSATGCFQRVVRGTTDQIKQNPHQIDWLENRMVNRILLGNAQRELGDDGQAAQSYEDAVADFQLLIQSLYRGQYHSENLAVALVNLSQIKQKQGETENVTNTLESAQHEFIQLIELHGSLPRYVRHLAATTVSLADSYRSQEQWSAANAAYAQADSVWKQLMQSDEVSNADQRHFVVCRVHWAESARTSGDDRLAREVLGELWKSRPSDCELDAQAAAVWAQALGAYGQQLGSDAEHQAARQANAFALELLKPHESDAVLAARTFLKKQQREFADALPE